MADTRRLGRQGDTNPLTIIRAGFRREGFRPIPRPRCASLVMAAIAPAATGSRGGVRLIVAGAGRVEQ